jgi:dipeptidyl aminopeptidase/acylaminoacyl peptidase
MSTTSKRLISAEDLYKVQLISSARISPDGKNVVYALHRVDPKTEKKYSNLWVCATAENALPRQFTFGDQNDGQPRWSQDGSQIAFLSNRGGWSAKKMNRRKSWAWSFAIMTACLQAGWLRIPAARAQAPVDDRS